MSVYVIANSNEECADWCTRNRVHPAGVTCVLDPRSLRGRVTAQDQVVDARVVRSFSAPPTPQRTSTQPAA